MKAWTNDFLESLRSQEEQPAINILKQGFPINFCINEEYPLTLAIKLGKENLADWILRAKVNVEVKDRAGKTPLLLAAEFGYLEMTKKLIALNSDFSMRDFQGNTVLHIASSEGHIEIVKFYMFNLRMPVLAKNNEGLTPLQLTRKRQESCSKLEDANKLQKVIETLWMNQSRKEIHCKKVPITPIKGVRSRLEEKKCRSIITYLTHRQSTFFRGQRSAASFKLSRYSSKQLRKSRL